MLVFSTSSGVTYVCIPVALDKSRKRWQAQAIRFGSGPLEGAFGLGATKQEAIDRARQEAEARFKL